MKIMITEIEATAEDLKASNSLADSMVAFLRGVLNSNIVSSDAPEEDEDDGED